MSAPVNLLERFGALYRVAFDEAYDHRHVPKRSLDPWMMQLPCQGSGVTIYPHGGNLLAVEVDHRRYLSMRLRTMGLLVHQDGNHEQTFLFDVKDFDRVAEVVRPRKRRHCHLTEEQRKANSERLKAFVEARRKVAT